MKTRLNEPSNTRIPLLEVHGVTREFGKGESKVFALRGISLSIEPGRLIALKGRSGSGKTTLLNMLAALDTPTKGQIYYNGRDVIKMSEQEKNGLRKKEIGLIFQSIALVSYMTAYENVEFGLRIAEVPASERKKRAEEALTFVGLAQRMHHRPQEMSGGEQQRTAIARAIAHKPKLILADEPTAELDSAMGKQVLQVFRKLVAAEGVSVVMTTHDPEMMVLADDVYALEDGQIGEQIIP